MSPARGVSPAVSPCPCHAPCALYLSLCPMCVPVPIPRTCAPCMSPRHPVPLQVAVWPMLIPVSPSTCCPQAQLWGPPVTAAAPRALRAGGTCRGSTHGWPRTPQTPADSPKTSSVSCSLETDIVGQSWGQRGQSGRGPCAGGVRGSGEGNPAPPRDPDIPSVPVSSALEGAQRLGEQDTSQMSPLVGAAPRGTGDTAGQPGRG